jgi:hypothetical protein
MTPPQGATVLMEGVSIIFRNFRGQPNRFDPQNTRPARTFGVLLDPETAESMSADDWHVKWLQPRDDHEEETEQAWLPVELKYEGYKPPRVVLVTSRGRTNLTENEVEMLDWVDITNVDLIVRAYNWDVNGKTGTKAYLASIYVTIEEDPLEIKYSELDLAREN